ncbi:HNH endonuclease [Burkholderia contaminans]|uniref:HNH endonuclease signature motif containing protein n=1 Tax=Burkholderia contaminans TaxID=488447 RepID=UPI000F5B06C1|nr:HNH endonuclease signature motif containing protein [Burkholderia contaminans]RQT19442.1 HNH endonuclease [Burkholderia contaminans]
MAMEKEKLKRQDFTVEMAREHFGYDPVAGRVIRLTNSPRGPRSAGKVASSLHKPSGFRQVVFKGLVIYEHHLVWALAYGYWPTGSIRHRDDDKQNNRVENLFDPAQVVTVSNLADTKDAFPGVIVTSSGNYRATIYRDKAIHLGTFSTPVEAHEMYLAAKVVLHSPLNRGVSTDELLKPLLISRKGLAKVG